MVFFFLVGVWAVESGEWRADVLKCEVRDLVGREGRKPGSYSISCRGYEPFFFFFWSFSLSGSLFLTTLSFLEDFVTLS